MSEVDRLKQSTPLPHHTKDEVCTTRPPYRQGRELRGVKVYTVSQESQYLIIQNVPSIGVEPELVDLVEAHGGEVECHTVLSQYPCPQFTLTYCVKMKHIRGARTVKRKLDDHSFYGSPLHICYAPELETVEDTRQKLIDRRRTVAHLCAKYEEDPLLRGPQPRDRSRRPKKPFQPIMHPAVALSAPAIAPLASLEEIEFQHLEPEPGARPPEEWATVNGELVLRNYQPRSAPAQLVPRMYGPELPARHVDEPRGSMLNPSLEQTRINIKRKIKEIMPQVDLSALKKQKSK